MHAPASGQSPATSHFSTLDRDPPRLTLDPITNQPCDLGQIISLSGPHFFNSQMELLTPATQRYCSRDDVEQLSVRVT